MKENHGFTLVEILVSILLLVLLGFAFFHFFVFSQKATTGSKEKLAAVHLAQSVLEQVKTNDYPEITENMDAEERHLPKRFHVDNACANDDQNCINRYKKTLNNRTYQIEIEVDHPKNTESNLLEVEVNVLSQAGKMETSVKGLIECSKE